ncbi:Squamous cell carcinoma antigen recognized by T-cells 3 [Triticum urartu]|uniref:Squamous cell carcinoma antigen recognized by T-cells 3 n=1 Tax=Triticum urartu TaxID=4572 RepID=M8ACQ8_TRIUA|nr:squamous cell carcinoma antigen recognized by T-cells 3 [Triticum urartu]EMS62530.1 Squamous cell carcinoma antigen recognized by T-cells 3 [Triticum urartu]
MATPMEEDRLEAAAAAPADVAGGSAEDGEKPDAPPMESDSDSSDSDDEGDAGDELRIQALERALLEQPLNYESHVQLIQCLRKSGNIEKLRAAREEMNKYFPLTPKMWQDWAKDEISLSSGRGSFDDIEKLYERGVQEYLNIKLWRDYLDYVEEHDQSVSQCSQSGLSKMRDLYERAITAGGLHVTEGSKLWEAYREYEMAILTINDGNDEEKAKQVQRVRALFHRQLSVPLADIESTLAVYKSWEAEEGNTRDPDSQVDDVPPNVLSAYKKASEMYNARKQYEDELSVAAESEANKLQVFLKYIKFEESFGDPARVQVLYERAVSELPVSSDLWMGYTSYLDRTLKVPAILKSVYHRATRNCTWVSDLWVHYLLSLERIRASEDELRHVFELAIQCSFPSMNEYLNIYLTRVDSLRRRMPTGLDFELIRQTFVDAAEFLSPQLGIEELLLLHAYWAKLECNIGKDIAAARGVWENALKKSGSVLEVWQHYISMEIEMGHTHEARSLYKRCYSKKFAGSGSEAVCHAWIRFEREHGTLDDYDLAIKKVTPRLKELIMFKAQQEAKSDPSSAPKETSYANDSSQKRKPSKMTSKVQPPAKKRKDNPPKKTVSSDDHRSKEQSTDSHLQEGGEVIKGNAEVPVEMKVEGDSKGGNTSSNQPKPYFYSDKCTAYMSNIDLKATELHIRGFFSDIGGVVDIRLLRDRSTKKSRGLAYVDFSDKDHLEAAIRKNKQKLLSKKVSVAPSDPSKSKKNREAGTSSKDKLPSGGDHGEKAPVDGTSEKEMPKGETKITGKNTLFAPRALVKPLGWNKKDEKPDVAAEELKSNDEFRNLLLKK